jgi:hypothetical protein
MIPWYPRIQSRQCSDRCKNDRYNGTAVLSCMVDLTLGKVSYPESTNTILCKDSTIACARRCFARFFKILY